jgi:hypothetical protein
MLKEFSTMLLAGIVGPLIVLGFFALIIMVAVKSMRNGTVRVFTVGKRMKTDWQTVFAPVVPAVAPPVVAPVWPVRPDPPTQVLPPSWPVRPDPPVETPFAGAVEPNVEPDTLVSEPEAETFVPSGLIELPQVRRTRPPRKLPAARIARTHPGT